MKDAKKCACRSLIINNDLDALRSDAIEMKYNTVGSSEEAAKWTHVQKVTVPLIRGDCLDLQSACGVDLEREIEKIENAVKHRSAQDLLDTTRTMRLKLFVDICPVKSPSTR